MDKQITTNRLHYSSSNHDRCHVYRHLSHWASACHLTQCNTTLHLSNWV